MSDEKARAQWRGSHQGIIILVGVAAMALLLLYLGTPASENWLIKCPLYQFTGWQCPLCGSQRAIHEMLHGRLAEAWGYNPALWVAMPYVALWGAGTLNPALEKYRMVRLARQDRVLAVVAVMLLLWGVVRNL